jgi:hypothetical protein
MRRFRSAPPSCRVTVQRRLRPPAHLPPERAPCPAALPRYCAARGCGSREGPPQPVRRSRPLRHPPRRQHRAPQRRLTRRPLTTLPSARKVADAHSWASCSASSTNGGHGEHSLAVQRMRGGKPRRLRVLGLWGGNDTPVSRSRCRPKPRSASPDAARPSRAASTTCEAGGQSGARHRGGMALRRQAQLPDDSGAGLLHCRGHTARPPLITLIGASGGPT